MSDTANNQAAVSKTSSHIAYPVRDRAGSVKRSHGFTTFVAWCGVEAVREGFRQTWEIGEIQES